MGGSISYTTSKRNTTMKKATLFGIIMALFLAATATAQNITYVSDLKKIPPKTKECLIFELDLTMLKGTEVVDEKGSKYIHTDFVPVKRTEVFYYSQSGRWWTCYKAKLSSSKTSINGSGESRQNIEVMNPRENSTDGFIAFTMGLSSLDLSTPPVQCHLAGQIETEWLEEEQRYVVKSGHGNATCHSYPTTWTARDFMIQAAPSTQSAIAPGWGTFTVRRAVLTDAEIINLLK